MEDRPFLYLTQPDVLEQINIDPRLRDAFVNVMKRMDAYFYANGYYKLKDYTSFFKSYLLNPFSKVGSTYVGFKIECNDEPSKVGAGGFYQRFTNRIVVDISCLSTSRLESVLCHEFIHFIVMHDLSPFRHTDEIYNGGFFNEALTEMLTQQIYPDSRAYEPLVKMVTFTNLLGNKVNDYRSFLCGHVQGPGHSWLHHTVAAKKYFEKFKDEGYRMREAVKDSDYIEAQRRGIEGYARFKNYPSFTEYIDMVDKLENRPVKDDEYIEDFCVEKEMSLIHQVYGLNSSSMEYLLSQFKILRRLRSLATEYGDTPVHKFSFHGRALAVDKDGKVYGDYSSNKRECINIGRNNITGKVSVYYNGDILYLELDKLHYVNYEAIYRRKVEMLKNYFVSSPRYDIETLSQFKKASGNVLRIEKFKAPRMDKRLSVSVYVAVYEDGIEVLNGFPPLGAKEEYRVADYVGLTSANPSEACIVSKNNRILHNGVVYSGRNKDFIRNKCQKWLANLFMSNMTDIEKQDVFEEYKTSSSYDEGDDLSDAMIWYVKKHYTEFDREVLDEAYMKVLNAEEKVIVSMNNGEVQVSYVFGDQVSFACERQVLVDLEHDAIFNHYFDSFDDTKVREDRQSNFVPFDDEGKLSLSTIINVDSPDRVLK